ncbi:Na+/H+ antiporter [Spirosoma endophyticum]|uniref:Sodium/proton antiporter, CPA1 family n=1 Tax=Spirosoma endophyticum TaxID=662367 RepID=A0A1I1MZD6_9BACT|nr:Na+/H+ antiporter [Spirosoma endophyticum]SFC90771.1 sodium/proton antiporter, CPA1 family [Spirosoma endophyticum]
MHQTLLLCLALMLAVTLLVMVGQRLRIPVPIFLVLSGLAVSLVPGIPPIEVDPELIFLIFLPPLLYEAAWFMSWKEFWRWRRIIVVLAFGLVLFTSFAVAYVSSAVIPGFTLALGFLLGGIISPPDAVAATSVLKEVNISKAAISILEGESLVNDAASLVVFRFALAAVLSGSFAWQVASVDFLLVTIMGIVVGLAVGGVFYAIHRWMPTTTRISILLTFIAPYIMYMTAEEFKVSGVMAVVSGGLFLSNQSHVILNHSSRIQGTGMWATVVFALNGLVFILIGLELPVIINGLEGYSKTEAVLFALLITAVVIVTRMVFTVSSSYFTQFIGKYITVAQRNPGWRGPFIIGWAGMRGVVSLASALSVPLALQNGTPFPHRNLILFITFVVILVTLVFQGLTLPLVIRWINPKDLDVRIPEDEQETRIRLKLLKVALAYLHENYAKESSTNELVENLKNRMESDLHQTKRHLDSLESDGDNVTKYNEIVTDIINVKREELHRLRSVQEFDDEVIRKEEAQMDLEEEKLITRFVKRIVFDR